MAVVACPPAVDRSKWNGPYTGDEDETEPLKDAWGQPLRYLNPGKKKPEWFDLWSIGPDGVDGTGDDIYAKKGWEWETSSHPIGNSPTGLPLRSSD